MFTLWILLWQISSTFGRGLVYPSIEWDPRNPLFACEDPLIKAHFNDEMSFVCPTKTSHQYILGERATPSFYETLHYVEREEDYINCNAQGGEHLLSCRPDSMDKSYQMPIAVTSSDSLPFQKGKIMHFIGTSFRSSKNMGQLQGGSCNNTDKENENKLRLRIYICTDEEIANGECELCATSHCYHASCGFKCSAWKKTEGLKISKEGKCFDQKVQTCSNKLTNEVRNTTRLTEVACPQQNCSECTVKPKCPKLECSAWQVQADKYVYTVKDGMTIQCGKQKTRQCTHPWNHLQHTEHMDVPINCTVTSDKKTDANNNSTKNKTDENTPHIVIITPSNVAKSTSQRHRDPSTSSSEYVIAGSVILGLLFGLALGAFAYKVYNNRKTRTENSKGFNNKVFKTESINLGDEDVVPRLKFAKTPPRGDFNIHLRTQSDIVTGGSYSPQITYSTPIKNEAAAQRYPNIERKASDLNDLMRPPRHSFLTRLQSSQYPTEPDYRSTVLVEEC